MLCGSAFERSMSGDSEEVIGMVIHFRLRRGDGERFAAFAGLNRFLSFHNKKANPAAAIKTSTLATTSADRKTSGGVLRKF